MHDQEIIHGDLKGVCVLTPDYLIPHQLMRIQGQHSNQQQRPRLYIRLQSAHHYLGPADLFVLMHRGRHNSVDESRTPRPGKFRVGEELPNERVGSLCARDGDL
jgi:hypothetical protein